MSTPKKQTGWIQYILLGVFILVLFFTDLGTAIRGGVQQLLLKTGIKDAPSVSNLETGKPAAPAQSTAGYPQLIMATLDNKPVALSELKGKVIFLNQWATWCPPCRAEMPAIQKLYQSVDTSKVAFVMLSLDEDSQKARQFVQQNDFTFPVYRPGGPMPEAFQAQAIPTTLILDPNGQLVQRIEGLANYDTDAFRQYLASLYSDRR